MSGNAMIAVDAMGGDYAPRVVVQGAYEAAKKGIPVCLYGDSSILCTLLTSLDVDWHRYPLTVEHCNESIGMEEVPTQALIRKKDASMIRALHAVASGKASAAVTAGNSGAALVAGTLILGRVEGILRPALGAFLPTKSGSIFCMDLGANVDCKPEYLEQFAIMGSVYSSVMKKIKNPRVALLSNGAEAYKGSGAVKEAYSRLLKSSLNFVGNLESRYIFDGSADVLVCDGFVGNILLKSIQGTIQAMIHLVEQEGQASFIRRTLFKIVRPIVEKIKQKTDHRQKGGSLLLGLKRPLIVGHGCSDALGITNAILNAHQVVQTPEFERYNIMVAHALAHTAVQSTLPQDGRLEVNNHPQ